MSRTESMSSSSTQQIKLKFNEAECPYCGSLATAEFEKGKQISPFTCTDQDCQAIEIGEKDEDRGMSEKEWETGWWEPMREPPEVRDTGINGFFLEGVHRGAYLQKQSFKKTFGMAEGIEAYLIKSEMFDNSTCVKGYGPHGHLHDSNRDLATFVSELKNRPRRITPHDALLGNKINDISNQCDSSGQDTLVRLMNKIGRVVKKNSSPDQQ